MNYYCPDCYKVTAYKYQKPDTCEHCGKSTISAPTGTKPILVSQTPVGPAKASKDLTDELLKMRQTLDKKRNPVSRSRQDEEPSEGGNIDEGEGGEGNEDFDTSAFKSMGGLAVEVDAPKPRGEKLGDLAKGEKVAPRAKVKLKRTSNKAILQEFQQEAGTSGRKPVGDE